MLTRKMIHLGVLITGSLSISLSVFSAPRVPSVLTENGLIYCTNANGFSFNPQTADAGTSMNVATEQIYNKLFEIKNNSSTLEPVLAKSFSVSEDGKKITINLRQGIKFHDTDWFTPTRDFNAEDVVFSLNRVLGHDAGILSSTEEINYKNPQYKIFHEQAKKVRFPFFESIKLSEKIQSVKATKPDQVEIMLYQPDSSVLSHLASQYAIILSQEYALQLSADNNLVQLDALPVGTGPYKVKNYIRNQYVRLEKNPDYWNQDAKINNIVIDLSTERTGRLVKFLNNECHISSNLEVSQLGLLKTSNNQYSLVSTEGMNLSYLAFNLQKPLIGNIDLRRAISQAIDRERIIKTIYHDTASVANNIIPDISWASIVNTPDYAYDYNPEKAKAYLSGKNLTLNIWVLNEEQIYNPSPIKMAELIKSDLEKVGVSVKVTNVTRTYLINKLRHQEEDYDIILTGWLAGNLDPDSFMRPILSCGTQTEITNLSNWCYAPFEHAMNQALIAKDLRTRARYYNIAQEIILSRLPIIPLANVKRLIVANDRVKGLKMSPFGNINFSTLSLKKENK